jgi:hypothetical protein
MSNAAIPAPARYLFRPWRLHDYPNKRSRIVGRYSTRKRGLVPEVARGRRIG